MEQGQIEVIQEKQRKIHFMGVKPLFFVLLAVYTALIIYVTCSWKLFYDEKNELWWLNLVYAGLFLLGIILFPLPHAYSQRNMVATSVVDIAGSIFFLLSD